MSTEKIEVHSFIDKAGQEVKRGDYIVYGSLLGRCAALKFGKVVNIKVGKNWRNEEQWAITVSSVDDMSYRHDWKPALCQKNGTLQFPDRIVKFDNIPQNYKDILDDTY